PQLVTGGSLIVHFQREFLAQPALDPEVVLVEVGATDVRIFGADAEQSDHGSAGTLFANVGNQWHILVQGCGIGELPRLRSAVALVGGERIGRIQAHVRGNVVEYVVVSH